MDDTALFEYSKIEEVDELAFWRLCDDDICHCDLRMTVHNCDESTALYAINMICLIWSIVVAVVGIGLLYHRLIILKQRLFDFPGKIPRPRPIETRAMHSIILITNVTKSAILRSFLFEFSWEFGTAALVCYLFGVVHTLASNSRLIYKSWIKSQSIVDIAFLVLLIFPFIAITPISMIAGYYSEKEDLDTAVALTMATYGTWTFYTFTIGTLVLVTGLRLLVVLRKQLFMHKHVFKKNGSSNHHSHNNNTNTSGTSHTIKKNDYHYQKNTEKMRHGVFKVKIIISAICCCSWCFTALSILYTLLRPSVMQSSNFTIIMCAILDFNGPLVSTVIEFALITDFKGFKGLSQLSFASETDTDDCKEYRNHSISHEVIYNGIGEKIQVEESDEDGDDESRLEKIIIRN
ncbi:unnamed protein product [Cunninghamella blakesleeana]